MIGHAAAVDVLPAVAEAARNRLGVMVTNLTKSPAFGYLARAEMVRASRVWFGWGLEEKAERAADVATMECIERWARFDGANVSVVRGSYRELAPVAVSPLDFGLYSETQYARSASRLARFDPDQPRLWAEMVGVPDGSQRLVPLELVRSGVQMVEPPLALESSSGTAVHTNRLAAATAATCEVVERDAALLWWHRRTSATLVTDLPHSAGIGVARLRADGHVVVVVRIDQDIAVPTYLAIAFRGRRVALGLGTHEDRKTALDHAVAELGAGLMLPRARQRSVHLPISMVRTAADHIALYDDGPLHDTLRSALDETLAPAAEESSLGQGALHALSEAGLCSYMCDLTPREVADCGLIAVRVLIPGLIPHYIGGDGLRLGHSRLVGRESPGTFRSLLPHPFG